MIGILVILDLQKNSFDSQKVLKSWIGDQFYTYRPSRKWYLNSVCYLFCKSLSRYSVIYTIIAASIVFLALSRDEIVLKSWIGDQFYTYRPSLGLILDIVSVFEAEMISWELSEYKSGCLYSLIKSWLTDSSCETALFHPSFILCL